VVKAERPGSQSGPTSVARFMLTRIDVICTALLYLHRTALRDRSRGKRWPVGRRMCRPPTVANRPSPRILGLRRTRTPVESGCRFFGIFTDGPGAKLQFDFVGNLNAGKIVAGRFLMRGLSTGSNTVRPNKCSGCRSVSQIN
jgi:hypothetical protein